MTTKTGRIVRAKLGADGRLRRVSASGKVGRVIPRQVDRKRIHSAAAFAPDADTPILTRRELRELKPVQVEEAPDVASLRRRLRLSQGAFATLFGIPLATVKDWEQGRRTPDAPARAYLRVIAQNPRAVRNALKTAAE
jgi:putative transcriptional regulator